MTAVDFYSHHHKRFSAVEYKVGSIDLATQLFRASYLDAHNRTYITGPYERDCVNKKCDLSAYLRRRRRDPPNVVEPDSELSRLRIFNADGHFAKEISNHVGPPGRRAIHSPGPLLWHL